MVNYLIDQSQCIIILPQIIFSLYNTTNIYWFFNNFKISDEYLFML